jgi:outer membrane lipase/esterase
MNSFRVRALALISAFGLAASATAQPAPRSFSNYYFFGDSLTDSGNTFALTGSPPAPYFNGRVSNGITYAEYLAPGLATAATASGNPARLNFAFAGATAMTGSAVPSLAQQVGLYQARGITANPNGLYVLLAGANDLLNAVQVPANQNATAMSSVGVGASSAVASAVQGLAALGAKNILVLNLPDISRTARFTTGSGAAGAMFVQTGVAAYNRDLTGRLGQLGLPADVRLTVFNLEGIFNSLLNNFQSFGYTVNNREYLGILQAGGNPGDVNGYIFWDGIHPTTRTHAIIAQAITEVLNPEFVLGTAAVQGTAVLAAADMASDAIANRLDLVRTGGAREGAHGFVSYSYKDGSRDFTGYQNEFSYTGSVVAAGFDLNVGREFIVGLAVTKESLEAKLKPAAGSFKLEGQTLSAYAQWKSGALFADASAGFGSHDVRSIARTTAFGGFQTSGKTDGERWTGQVRVGYDLATDTFHFTPFAGLRYTKADIGAYTETGVSGLNFVFDEQTAKQVDGLVGATADWQIRGGNLPLALGGFVMFQKDLADDVREFSGRLADTLTPTSRIAVQDGLEESIKFGVRLGGAFSKRWGWSAGYMAEIRDDGDTASQYSLSLHTGF